MSSVFVVQAMQSLLLNGPSTNAASCPERADQCWGWGLTPGQYYLLVAGVVGVLFVPIAMLHEPDPAHTPQHTLGGFFEEVSTVGGCEGRCVA
jgi:hypothetical protein